jgi:molybdopterin synthase sulfur carrier subunit
MKVNVLAFGIAKEIFGTNHVAVEFEGNTSEDLKSSLEQQFPHLKQLPTYLLAVNSEYAPGETELKPNDEIAIIPPVSGG